MKCLIFFLFSVILFVAAVNANSCDEQFEHLTAAYTNCTAGNFSETALQGYLHRLADGKLNESEFNEIIEAQCPLFNATTACRVEYKSQVNDQCTKDKRIKKKLNLEDFLLIVVTEFCANNAKGYKDLVKLDGAECLMKNTEHMQCFNATEPHIDLASPEIYSDALICPFIKAMITCLPHYEHCENDHVHELFGKVNQKFKEQFHCEFEV